MSKNWSIEKGDYVRTSSDGLTFYKKSFSLRSKVLITVLTLLSVTFAAFLIFEI